MTWKLLKGFGDAVECCFKKGLFAECYTLQCRKLSSDFNFRIKNEKYKKCLRVIPTVNTLIVPHRHSQCPGLTGAPAVLTLAVYGETREEDAAGLTVRPR